MRSIQYSITFHYIHTVMHFRVTTYNESIVLCSQFYWVAFYCFVAVSFIAEALEDLTKKDTANHNKLTFLYIKILYLNIAIQILMTQV